MSLLDDNKATGGTRENIFTDDGNRNAGKRRRTSDSVNRMTDAARKRQRASDGDLSMSNASKKRQRSSDSVTRMTDQSNKRQRTSESHCRKHASTEGRKVTSHDGKKQAATSRKKQPSSDKTSSQQAPKRKTAARMKWSGTAEDGTLRLVLEPSAAPVKLRRKFRGTPLDVHGRSVCGCVNGRDCSFMLDCGSSVNIVLFSVAKKLGLVTGQEQTMTTKIAMWMGTKVLDVIMLDKVAITLGKKVEIHIPFLVLPESIELYYRKLRNVLLLGIPVLRKLNAVQTFAADRSRLYIRLPRGFKACLWRWRAPRQPKNIKYTFQVRRLQDRKRLRQVMVDTGATMFYVSEKTRVDIMRRGAKAPRRVSIDIGGGNCLEAEPLEVGPPMTEFLIGIKVLRDYEAVLDYGKYSLTLNVGGKYFKVKLGVQ